MREQDRNKDNKRMEENGRELLGLLKKLDGEEFILSIPIYEEEQNHERTKSI